MKHEDIRVGDYVLYIPKHADNNLSHKDVEKGIVTSKNSEYVFVRFGGDYNSKACTAYQLH